MDIVMSKEEFRRLITVLSTANAVESIIYTLRLMDENHDLTLDNVIDFITGVYSEVADDANDFIRDYNLNGVDINNIKIED